ncbi:MAG: hypothetical protein ROR55_11345 [Devosia sp.]
MLNMARRSAQFDTPPDDALDRWNDEGGACAVVGGDSLGEASQRAFTEAECRILHFLGAAVVLHWNEMPTDVQRTIFKLASADGGSAALGEFSTPIARFLHDHKDDLDGR